MVRKNVVKRSISGIIFAGLLTSTLPTPTLYAAAQPKKAPLKISQAEIQKHVANVKKVVTGVKALKIVANIALTGTGVGLFVISLTLGSSVVLSGVPFLLMFLGTPVTILATLVAAASAPVAAVGAAGVGAVGTAAAAIVAYLAFEVILWGGQKYAKFQIKSTQWLLEKGVMRLARKGVDTLERIEQNYPGTLTLEQKTIIDQFNKLVKGRTMKSIMEAARLDGLIMDITKSVIMKTNALGRDLKEAIKIVRKYIKSTWRIKSYKKILDAHAEKKRKYQATIKERSPLSVAYHKARVKLIMLALTPQYHWAKLRKAQAEKTLRNLNKKYPYLKPVLQEFLPDFIQKAEAIVQKYAAPLVLLQKKLRTLMKTIIKSVVMQNLKIALLSEREKAYWVVREYVELKWKSRNLQRTMDAFRQKSKSSVLKKAFSMARSAVWAVLQLKLMKFKWFNYVKMKAKKGIIDRRIKKIEKNHPKLQRALKDAWQEFSQKADAIIMEGFGS